MDLAGSVKKIIFKENLIEEGDKLLLGVSGGIDSTTLLFVLLRIRETFPFELGLAHIDYGLRGRESDRDAQFVKDLARRFTLPFYTKKIQKKEWTSRSGLSTQHAGRELRYAFFANTAHRYHYNKIATAHTIDDRVETFLLRVIKGTGVRGLSSIPIKRGAIIRPFLFTYRKDIEEYAERNNIPFVADSSNERNIYERNFVRKEIIPTMVRLNPTIKEKIILLLQDLTNINKIFDTQYKEYLLREKVERKGEIMLPIGSLKTIDEETRFRVFSDIITSAEPQFIPLRRHIFSIEKIMWSSRPNLVITLPQGLRVKKQYEKLVFTRQPPPASIEGRYKITTGTIGLDVFKMTFIVSILKHQPQAKSLGSNTALFDAAKILDISVRTFHVGDRFVPYGMHNKVKLKDFFISQKIPKEQRRLIPLLLSGNDIIWIIGYRIDDKYKVTAKTKKVLKVVVKDYP